jgi:hypothetical protein
MPPDNNAQPPAADEDKAPATRARAKWSQSPWLLGVGTAVIAGLLLTAIYGVYHHLRPSPAPAPGLQLRNVSVTSAWPLLRPERVDLTFLNTGSQTALLTRASVRIQEFTSYAVPQSFYTGVFVLPDHQYLVTMPLRPGKGQVISVPLSEAAAAGGTDDFGLDFKLPRSAGAFVYLYRVAISVHYGKTTHPLELLISLPIDPGPPYDRCSSTSTSAVCVFLRLPGYRPPGMPKPPPSG